MIEIIVLVSVIIWFSKIAKSKGLNGKKWGFIAGLSYLFPMAIFSLLIFPTISFGWINETNSFVFKIINILVNIGLGVLGLLIAKQFLINNNNPNFKKQKTLIIVSIFALIILISGLATYSFKYKLNNSAKSVDLGNLSGVKKLNEGNYKRAIEDFTIYLKKYPDNSIAYFNRGTAYGQSRKFDSAIIDLKLALRFNNYTDDGTAYSKTLQFLTECYQMSNMIDSSLVYCQKSIEIMPSNIDMRYAMLYLLITKGDTAGMCKRLDDYSNLIYEKGVKDRFKSFYDICME